MWYLSFFQSRGEVRNEQSIESNFLHKLKQVTLEIRSWISTITTGNLIKTDIHAIFHAILIIISEPKAPTNAAI